MMSSEKHIEAVGETDPELTEAEVALLLAMDRNDASDFTRSSPNGENSDRPDSLFRAHLVTQTFLKAERDTLNSKDVGNELWSNVARRIEETSGDAHTRGDAKVIPLKPNKQPHTQRRTWTWLLVAAAAFVVGALGWRALTSAPRGEVAHQNTEHQLDDVDGLDVELLGPPDNHQELYQAETSSGLATIIWVGEPTVEKPEAGS